MDTLQRSLDNVIKEYYTADKMLAEVIFNKIKGKGIVLSTEQIRELEKEFKVVNLHDLNFQIDDEKAIECPNELKNKSLSITISEQNAESIYNKITQVLEETIPDIAFKASEEILETLRKNFKGEKKERQKGMNAFRKDLGKAWRKPLDLLKMLCYIATETGEAFSDEDWSVMVKENNLVFEVLARLQARSCQVTSEIITLLENGFSDGAHARWRTLHEIAVCGIFVENHGQELAERYICHKDIESYKAALKYQECCEFLGYEKLSKEEFKEIKKSHDILVEKYGKNYKNQFGWAAEALNKDKPNFSDIEKAVGLDYLRPYYKMASHNVHANPTGIFFKLGLYPESADILLTGPSNIGLADPGQCTAISLVQITMFMLLSFNVNLDRLVLVNILRTLEEEIAEAFNSARIELEEQ